MGQGTAGGFGRRLVDLCLQAGDLAGQGAEVLTAAAAVDDFTRASQLLMGTGGQLPPEAEGVDAQHHPQDIVVVHLRLSQEVSAVHQAKFAVFPGTLQKNRRKPYVSRTFDGLYLHVCLFNVKMDTD